MADLDLATFKEFPQQEKDLINGFIRQCQLILPKESAYHIIPDSINIICELFYFLTDQWNRSIVPPKYSLSDDCKTLICIESIAFEHSTAFLSQIASSCHHHWRFRVQKGAINGFVVIAIVKVSAMLNGKGEEGISR